MTEIYDETVKKIEEDKRENEERKRLLSENLKQTLTSRRATHQYKSIHLDKVLDVKVK